MCIRDSGSIDYCFCDLQVLNELSDSGFVKVGGSQARDPHFLQVVRRNLPQILLESDNKSIEAFDMIQSCYRRNLSKFYLTEPPALIFSELVNSIDLLRHSLALSNTTPLKEVISSFAVKVAFSVYEAFRDANVQGALSASHLDLLCLLYTSPSPRDATLSRMPSSA